MSLVDLRGRRVWLGVRENQHVPPALGNIRLEAESSLSAQSVRLMHALIRNVLADAEREELVHRNVAKLVRPPRAQRQKVHALTVEDARRLVRVIRAIGSRRSGYAR